MHKPQVGIASVWYEGNPATCTCCDLAAKVKEGVTAAGLVGMRFNTIGVSDGISMGTDGMSFSLQSRDLIADSIETVMGGQWYDAQHLAARLRQEHAGLPHGDGPAESAVADGLRRHDSRRLTATDKKLDVVSAFQSYGEFSPATSTKQERQEIVRHCLPGRGRLRRHVHGQHDGVGDRGAGHVAAVQFVDAGRRSAEAGECSRAGAAIRNLLERDLKPRDIMTRDAFENAMVLVTVLGGSTNAVLHLIAMARSVGRAADDRRFPEGQQSRRRCWPTSSRAGKYVMEDLHAVGGTPAVMKMLLDDGLLDGSCMTVTGKTHRGEPEGLAGAQGGSADRHAVVEPDQADRPYPDSARQSGARRRGGENHRQGRPALLGPGEGLRFRRGHAGMRWSGRRSTRAT